MSHGDTITAIPANFKKIASTDKVDRENRKRFSWWRLKKVSVKDRSSSARGKYSEGERERRGGNS
uniref:hypothetical protein n=1 Tax=Campylobacter lari TaxID=201 RepID=UPI001C2BDD5A